MTRAHEKGMIIALNPSPMNEKINALPLDFVDIFLLNEVEAGQILGSGERDQEELAGALREKFPAATIVLTLGGEGSLCIDKDEVIRQSAFRVQVVDTTAAGDTFTGFLIGGLLRGEEKASAMREASAAAAIACSRPGAAPSIPTPDEVQAFLRERE